jgi:hypothetical protein
MKKKNKEETSKQPLVVIRAKNLVIKDLRPMLKQLRF